MHVEVTRVMSPRDDAPCRYVNSAMLIVMKSAVAPAFDRPNTTHRTVSELCVWSHIDTLQSRLRTTREYRDAFGGV